MTGTGRSVRTKKTSDIPSPSTCFVTPRLKGAIKSQPARIKPSSLSINCRQLKAIIYLLYKALSSPHLAARSLWKKVVRKWHFHGNKKKDINQTTHATAFRDKKEPLHRYLFVPILCLLESHKRQILALSDLYLDHCFDLLGSGWVQVKHGIKCQGLEGFRYNMGKTVKADPEGRWLVGRINQANLKAAQRIWQLVDKDYTPIDWQLDFKSGYRWNESTWYMNVPSGYYPGRDMKIPWELSRCQHFHMLAWAFALTNDQRYLREYRNQILDFVATNPPRFGIAWRCTMDVSIRVANWLMAYDLFRAHCVEWDNEFEAEFMRSIYEHGLHIVTNLEWDPELRTNHYLSDIIGLLFVAAYLPRSPETDAWLAFAIQELVNEVEHQFTSDGANFEASTSYHRLSAEMVTYATALVLGLPPEKQAALKEYDHRLHRVRPRLKPGPLSLYPLPGSRHRTPFPAWYIERLEKMAEFTMHITKPNGHFPQIGDNDSGRFVKLQPVYHRMTVAKAKTRYANLDGYTSLPDDATYWDEDHLDHRHLVAAINGLFGRDDFTEFTGSGWLETDLVRHLVKGVRLPTYRQEGRLTAAERVRVGTKRDWERLNAEMNAVPKNQRHVFDIPVPGGDLSEEGDLYAYPDFGLYLYRSKRLYLAIRCGPIGQDGIGGHAHNDQLSIELNVDGVDWISDPGTYLYTPLPERRNEYRSVKAHFAPQVEGREPGRLDLGRFRLGDDAKAECSYFGREGFIGMHQGYGDTIYRIVRVMEYGVRVIDYIKQSISRGNNNAKAGLYIGKLQPPTLSPGYGIRHSYIRSSYAM